MNLAAVAAAATLRSIAACQRVARGDATRRYTLQAYSLVDRSRLNYVHFDSTAPSPLSLSLSLSAALLTFHSQTNRHAAVYGLHTAAYW